MIFTGSLGYETVYRSRLEACNFFRRAIAVRNKPIAMTSILEHLCVHGSGCHAFSDLAGSSVKGTDGRRRCRARQKPRAREGED
jgi:hypothetical protein